MKGGGGQKRRGVGSEGRGCSPNPDTKVKLQRKGRDLLDSRVYTSLLDSRVYTSLYQTFLREKKRLGIFFF